MTSDERSGTATQQQQSRDIEAVSLHFCCVCWGPMGCCKEDSKNKPTADTIPYTAYITIQHSLERTIELYGGQDGQQSDCVQEAAVASRSNCSNRLVAMATATRDL